MRMASLLTALVLSVSLFGQVATIGTGTVKNTTTSYPAPYGNAYAGTRQQYLIRASELTAALVPSGATITAVGFDVAAPNPSAAPLQHFEIKMGHTTAQNLFTWQVLVAPAAFPCTFTESPGWSQHVLNAPFTWDGVSNLVIEVCFWNGPANYTNNAVVNQTATSFVSSLVHVADNSASCGTTFPGMQHLQRPNIRLITGVAHPPYQVNRAGSNLDLGGLQGNFYTPAVTRLCPGGQTTLSWMSLSPLPGDIWVQSGGPIPFPSSGYGTPSGQVANVNLADPAGFWVIGLSEPNTQLPFVPLSLPVGGGAASLVASAQAINLDASSSDGFSLSQPVGLEVAAGLSLPGPAGDDTFVQVSLPAPPLCHNGVSFYGTTYTDFYVSSNGRVTFRNGSTSPATPPSWVVYDDPMAGAWTDLDPSAGGSIGITANGSLVTVNYQAVPYLGQALPCSFGIQLDPAGNVVLRNIDGIGPLPATGAMMFLGISNGNAAAGGMALDPGQTTFAVGPNPGPSPGPNDMIYQYGTPGLLAPGVTDIWFIWGGAAYDWVCY